MKSYISYGCSFSRVSETSNSPTVLFLARNYPPKVGGDQKYNHELAEHLKQELDVHVLPNRLGNAYVPFFLLEAMVKLPYYVREYDVDVLLVSDATLAPLAALLKRLFGLRVVVKVNGLDITFDNLLFQQVVPRATADAGAIICLSEGTREACISRGVPPEKIHVIPPGISVDDFYDPSLDREQLAGLLETEYGVEIGDGQSVLLSVGRAIERKGFHWFASEVVPLLDDDYVYLIAGKGEYQKVAERAAEAAGVADRVFTLGYVPDEHLSILYNTSDVFVMPNVPVEGDMEGFGMVTAEAASCGTPTVASKLEGIKDAVIEEKTGYLVERSPETFAATLQSMNLDSTMVRQSVVEAFSWQNVIRDYIEVLMRTKER